MAVNPFKPHEFTESKFFDPGHCTHCGGAPEHYLHDKPEPLVSMAERLILDDRLSLEPRDRHPRDTFVITNNRDPLQVAPSACQQHYWHSENIDARCPTCAQLAAIEAGQEMAREIVPEAPKTRAETAEPGLVPGFLVAPSGEILEAAMVRPAEPESCASCRFGRPLLGEDWPGADVQCRRHAPQQSRFWPRSGAKDWCGEYQRKAG